MRGVSRQATKLPNSNQPPQVLLSKELVSPTDLRFVSQKQTSVSAWLSLSVGDSLLFSFRLLIGQKQQPPLLRAWRLSMGNR